MPGRITTPDASNRAVAVIRVEPVVPGLEHEAGHSISEGEAADIWIRDVLEPSLGALIPAIGPGRDPLQAYSDVLETKWMLSEGAGKDIGLRPAIDAYLGLGAPAPEGDGRVTDSGLDLDIDWSGGWEAVPEDEPGS